MQTQALNHLVAHNQQAGQLEDQHLHRPEQDQYDAFEVQERRDHGMAQRAETMSDVTKRRDEIGELEGALFDRLSEATALARQLALLCRMNQTAALALAQARGRESSEQITRLVALENPPRRKARKGANGH